MRTCRINVLLVFSLRCFFPPKDFETHGVFDAQAALEEKHRQEEDALYRQIFDDRKNHVANMERRLAAEKEKAVRELIAWFDKRGVSAEERKDGMKTVGDCVYRCR